MSTPMKIVPGGNNAPWATCMRPRACAISTSDTQRQVPSGSRTKCEMRSNPYSLSSKRNASPRNRSSAIRQLDQPNRLASSSSDTGISRVTVSAPMAHASRHAGCDSGHNPASCCNWSPHRGMPIGWTPMAHGRWRSGGLQARAATTFTRLPSASLPSHPLTFPHRMRVSWEN